MGTTTADTHTMDDQNRSFPILDLPAELVGAVCEQLDDATLVAIRQVSRAFRDHSYTAFGTYFFHHLVVILHPISLSRFLDICRHDKLSKYVRKVTVSGELLAEESSTELVRQAEAVQQCDPVNSAMQEKILVESFRTLVNLLHVRIDVASFDRAEDYGIAADGIRCARYTILCDTDYTYSSSSTPVYELVL